MNEQTRLLTIQKECKEWSLYNFGNNRVQCGWAGLEDNVMLNWLAPQMGIGEELAELTEALQTGATEGIKDAIGDTLLYLIDFASRFGIEVTGDVEGHWMYYPALYNAMRGYGMIQHAVLKRCQGIRGYDLTSKMLREVGQGCDIIYAQMQRISKGEMNVDAIDILEQVWQEVRQRDWTKNNKDGNAQANSSTSV